MDRAAIEWLTTATLSALARSEVVPPPALLLLVREYAATGRDDLAAALGPALARGLDLLGAPHESERRAEWLDVFAEAAAISEDERLPATAAAIARELLREWPCQGRIRSTMRAVEACLGALEILGVEQAPPFARAAVDELERVVAIAYEPGAGLVRSAGTSVPADLADHIAASLALLTAYTVTGRLTYSMLAEELMQAARRRWWDVRRVRFLMDGCPGSSDPASDTGGAATLDEFVLNCGAVRALSRIAALHRDPSYQQAAVVAPGSDYAGDARRILAFLDSTYRTYDTNAAIYGVVLGEVLR